ncbi:site-specific integrase [Deinococcus aquatilis]|uniref:site-specific integrase n=1 Tax=Deinococcus aquatilis TaxID=519440 RepID=UPI000363697F|nr:site-specific integrase [Deinococcus aquatilis]
MILTVQIYPTVAQLTAIIRQFGLEHTNAYNPARTYTYGAQHLLEWLETYPGETWQARWLVAEADFKAWPEIEWVTDQQRYYRIRRALSALIALRILQPSYAWLHATPWNGMLKYFEEGPDKVDVQRILETAKTLKFNHRASYNAVFTFSYIAIHTGKTLSALSHADLMEYEENRTDPSHRISCNTLHFVLRALDIVTEDPKPRGKKSLNGPALVDKLLDQYKIVSPFHREVLHNYLSERQIQVVQSVFRVQTHKLLAFWQFVTEHATVNETFLVPHPVMALWKDSIRTIQRNQVLTIPAETLRVVRTFYRYLNSLALDDPEHWGTHEAYAPIQRSELQVAANQAQTPKQVRQNLTRLLVNHGGGFRKALKQHHNDTVVFLERARQLEVDQTIERGHTTYRRTAVNKQYLNPYGVTYTMMDEVGANPKVYINLEDEEERAFWCWACVELFLETGLRPVELYRLQVSDIQPRTSENGEVVPSLFVPSAKIIVPRIIDLSSRAAEVIAKIIERMQGDLADYPYVDRFEMSYGKFALNAQLLLQRHGMNIQIGLGNVAMIHWLDAVQNILRAEGNLPEDVRYLPRDFRHIFATRLHDQGVSLLEISNYLGHKNINTTLKYIAPNTRNLVDHLNGLND